MIKHMTFIARSKIPSRHANSVQVVNMICALAPLVEHLDVHLPGRFGQWLRLWTGTLFSRYGRSLPGNVRVRFRADSKHPEGNFEDNVLRALSGAHDATIFTRSPRIALALAERHRPVIFESHVFSRDARQVPMPRFIDTFNSSRPAAVVGISKEIADEFLSAGLSPGKVMTAPDGVDLEAFAGNVSGGLVRLFGEQIHDRPTLVYVGSLRPEKGAGFLAGAASGLRNVHIVIVGGSPKESAALASTWKDCANLFVHPSVPHKDVPAILQDADMLAMPYMPEGDLIQYMSPLKLFEYLAAGKPILAADLPVLRPFLCEGQNALLFSPGSTEALCGQVNRLMGMSPGQRSVLIANQRNTALRYSWANRAKTILDWYLGVLQGTHQ